MLKEKTDKLESRIDVYFFVGYPRGMKYDLFYCSKDQKVNVNTNARFLEEDYVMNHKPKSTYSTRRSTTRLSHRNLIALS